LAVSAGGRRKKNSAMTSLQMRERRGREERDDGSDIDRCSQPVREEAQQRVGGREPGVTPLPITQQQNDHSSSSSIIYNSTPLGDVFPNQPVFNPSRTPIRSVFQSDMRTSIRYKVTVVDDDQDRNNIGIKRRNGDDIHHDQEDVRTNKMSRKAPDERRQRIKNLASRSRPRPRPLQQRRRRPSQVPSSPTPTTYMMRRTRTMVPVSQLDVPSLRRTASVLG
jgi:hypothetical protein